MNDDQLDRESRDRRRGEPLPLDSVRETFALLVAGPRPLSVDGRDFPGLPGRMVALDELRARLMARSCPTRTRDAVWTYLVTQSRRQGGAWTVGCVGVALPGLAHTAGWMAARYRGDRWDVHAAVITGFLHGLATVDVAEPRIAHRLWWTARRAGLEAVTEALNAPLPVDTGFRSAPPPQPSGHPDFVLADAVTTAVITTLEADLIGATRLEDSPVTVWAAAHGMTHWAAYKMRSRAEQRLVGYLADRMAGQDPDVPDEAVGLDTDAHPYPRSRPVRVRPPRSRCVTSPGGPTDRPGTAQAAARVSKQAAGSGLFQRGHTAPAAASASLPEENRCA